MTSVRLWQRRQIPVRALCVNRALNGDSYARGERYFRGTTVTYAAGNKRALRSDPHHNVLKALPATARRIHRFHRFHRFDRLNSAEA